MTSLLEESKFDALTRLMGEEVRGVEPLFDGRNSRVIAFATASGDRYVAKFSRPSTSDPRDRLGTEFRALSFLWREGLRRIPEPVLLCQKSGVLVSRRLDGRKIAAKDLTLDGLEQFICFLVDLQNFKEKVGRIESVGRASEACFSHGELTANLRSRMERLKSVAANEPELKKFIQDDLSPRLKVAEENPLAGELSPERRILSPSDFGTHNSLQSEDGVFRFFDFEYFGWDDPAKAIADFCLHPAMNLVGWQRRHFALTLMSRLQHGAELSLRIKTLFPLYGWKWCLILLNEFLPEVYSRREMAGGEIKYGDQRKVRMNQLAKAQAMLRTIDMVENDLR